MKKTILSLLSLASLSLVQSVSALALPYTDYYDVDQVRETLDASNPEVGGVWNISVDANEIHPHDILGFNGFNEVVTNAAVMFVFYEQQLDGGYNVDLTTFNIGGFDTGSAPDAVEVIFDSRYFGSVYADILFDIQQDGELEWMVKLSDTNASVGVWSAILGVEVEQVPDTGSAFALLGIACIGLAIFRRKVSL